MKHKGLWLGNGIVGSLIIAATVWVIIRRVDGSGYVETAKSRVLELGILAMLLLLVLFVDLIILWLGRASSRQ